MGRKVKAKATKKKQAKQVRAAEKQQVRQAPTYSGLSPIEERQAITALFPWARCAAGIEMSVYSGVPRRRWDNTNGSVGPSLSQVLEASR